MLVFSSFSSLTHLHTELSSHELHFCKHSKFEQLDGKVNLSWTLPKDQQQKVKAFLISYFAIEDEKMGKYMRVVKVNDPNEEDNENYKEEITGLDENKFYNFDVRSYSHNDDLSERSNPIVVKPQKYNTEVPTEDIIVEKLPDYYKFCNIIIWIKK